MAHIEPMEIDTIGSDFDNKENSFHHNNVLSRTPCTEKGYEELDVSELNMKLRYSHTPISSPMSKSLTGPCLDIRNSNSEDHHSNIETDNCNLTRSLNSTLAKTEIQSKSKILPLQTLSADPFVDINRNSSIRRLLDSTDNNVIISVTNSNDMDENLSLPSTCSSMPDTPEATTPTKETPKPEGSPIMRGLKSVLSMFRPSQNYILSPDDNSIKPEILSPVELHKTEVQTIMISRSIVPSKQRDTSSSKRSSPLKDSLVFNDDLERELQWKDECTITSKSEIPVHKIVLQNPIPELTTVSKCLDATVEDMDISCDEAIIANKTLTNVEENIQHVEFEHSLSGESKNQFLDYQTTFSKSETYVNDKIKLEKDSENVTIRVSGIDGTSIENKSKCQNPLSNTTYIEPREIIVSEVQASGLLTDLSTEENKINIIEATINLLNSERNHCSRIHEYKSQHIDLQNKSQCDKELLLDNLTNITPVDEQIIKEDGQSDATETKTSSNIVTTFKLMEDKEIKENECQVDNLPIDCAESLNNTTKTEEITIEDLYAREIKHNITYSNTLVNMDIVESKSSINLLPKNKGSVVVTDGEKSANNQNLNDSGTDFNNVLDEDHKITDNTLMTHSSNSGHYMPTTTLLSINNLINSTDTPSAQSEVIDELNTTDNSMEPKLQNLISSGKSRNCNIGGISQISVNDNTITQIANSVQNLYILENINLAGDNMSDTNNIFRELKLETDRAISKLPSEIPLPDDDNESKDNCNKKNSSLKLYEKDSDMTVEKEVVVDCMKKSMLTSLKENEGTPLMNNEVNNCRELVNKVNKTETCITQSVNERIDEVQICDMSSQNVICGLKIAQKSIAPEENSSESISFPELIYKNVKQDAAEMQRKENSCKSTTDNIEFQIIEEKVACNIDDISPIIEIVNVAKSGDITTDKSQKTNQIKMASENPQVYTVEKKAEEIDEEIVTSANNSPYVSLTDLNINADKINEDLMKKNDISFAVNATFESSPPKSPKIVSKGYNFNFDEVDDPFATKTKIRMSPTLDSPNKTFDTITKEIKTLGEESQKDNIKQKLQSERKKTNKKKNMNSTLNYKLTINDPTSEKQTNSAISNPGDNEDNMSTLSVKENILRDEPDDFINTTSQCHKIYQKEDGNNESLKSNAKQVNNFNQKDEIQLNDGETRCLEQTLVISTDKSTSSSEQYFSFGTSSGESSGLMNRSKNVFNLPEIDDMNFNPFTTKSKMRMSPPPSENSTSPLVGTNNSSFVIQEQSDFNTTTIIKDTDRIFNKKVTKDSSFDTSIATCSTNTCDINSTVREILTEDEDTVEGPFIEAEDLKDTDKQTDMCDETGVMNFGEIPQDRDGNVDNGEVFIDADAFEFLLNQNKSTTVMDSGKESLFLKFDPLFAERVSSDGILAALNKVQKRQSTPKKVAKVTEKDLILVEKVTAGLSHDNENSGPVDYYNEDLSSVTTKPMMVVNPAVSSIITQKKTVTPKLNRRSLTFTSPAMAVIDRLLSLSGNSTPLNHDSTIPQRGRDYCETDLAITQLRELLAEKEINVHNLRSESKELKDRLALLEVQVRDLEIESAERLGKINELNDKLFEKTKTNKNMALVVEEYERTIASLIAETEQDKKHNAEERMKLIKERDEQTAHLTSMEVSFSDLHSKYEKSKQVILSCKENEDIYKKSIKEFQQNFLKMENNYELLKQHATSKLNHANQELEKMNRVHEAEVLKLKAMMKRKELHITSLEETVAQKTKANEELTAICDELINKVG